MKILKKLYFYQLLTRFIKIILLWILFNSQMKSAIKLE
jgi:hypothetical protein